MAYPLSGWHYLDSFVHHQETTYATALDFVQKVRALEFCLGQFVGAVCQDLLAVPEKVVLEHFF